MYVQGFSENAPRKMDDGIAKSWIPGSAKPRSMGLEKDLRVKRARNISRLTKELSEIERLEELLAAASLT